MTRTKHDFQPCVPGAFPGGLRRTEFYDGMVLGEDDMKREQSYWQMKRRLTNRALGQGVVWGLAVRWDEKARAFTICPGYGLSCCGDDLVVECAATASERALVDVCGEDFREIVRAAQGPCDDPCDRRPDDPVEACLMLEYVECAEDPRQVFEDPCATLPGGCRFGAVRETTRLRLVPPPRPDEPGAIARFCAKIDKLRDMLAASGGIVPAPAAGPDTGRPPAVILDVALRDTADNTIGGARKWVATAAAEKAEVVLPSAGATRVVVTLTPPLGYGFLSMLDDTGTVTRIETLMGLSLVESDLAQNWKMDRRFTVELAPLAGGDAYEADYHVLASGGQEVDVSVEVEALRGPKRTPDCATLMRRWMVDVDPGCLARTLVLAAVCGWFKGLTGTAPCNDPPDVASRTRTAIAALACWLAWRILWRIDMDVPAAAGAERCLRKLFEEWCDEFNYRGPRCEGGHHGILLGCVGISPKGRILCFDEWKHRRYVLTGPLLTHWAGLFGVAPPDVMATRLAGWICCVARTPDIALDPAEMKAIREQLVPTGDELRLGGGDTLPLPEPGGVLAWLRSGFASGPSAPPPAAPAPGFGNPFARRLEAGLDTAPIMARRPALDMMMEVKAATALSDLRPLGDAGLFDATVEALGRAGITSTDALLSRDPETVARLVAPGLAEDGASGDAATAEKSVAQVYTAALRAVEAVGAAVAAQAGERADDQPFTRADMRDGATTSAIRKALNEHLRGKGLSVGAVRDIAGRVAERR